MRPGYKQTEVGVIPEDWEIDSIINLAHITTGDKDTQDRVTDGAYPFFVRSQTVERINSFSFDGEAVLTAGDGVGTGKIFHYIDGKFDFHQRVYKISDFAKRLNGYYFFLYFSNHFFSRIMQMTAKSSVDSVRREMIANMQIPLPPVAEQRAIAAALSDVDALLAELDQIIAKKRDLKQAAMQQLLTGQTRMPGYNAELQVHRLGEIGTFGKGKGITKDDLVSGGIPCVRYGEIYTRHNDCIRAFYSFITPRVAASSQRLRNGDLLFAGSGETAEEIGKCVAFLGDDEAYAGGDIVICHPVDQDSMYLAYLMNHPVTTAQKARMAQGDAVVHISARNLAQLEMRLPAKDEQTTIAAAISDMGADIAALEARREKTRLLKQGMIQELLTGRVRLV